MTSRTRKTNVMKVAIRVKVERADGAYVCTAKCSLTPWGSFEATEVAAKSNVARRKAQAAVLLAISNAITTNTRFWESLATKETPNE